MDWGSSWVRAGASAAAYVPRDPEACFLALADSKAALSWACFWGLSGAEHLVTVCPYSPQFQHWTLANQPEELTAAEEVEAPPRERRLRPLPLPLTGRGRPLTNATSSSNFFDRSAKDEGASLWLTARTGTLRERASSLSMASAAWR